MIATLQVIWINDDLIRPPGPKMVVCVCPKIGIFLHINSKGWRAGSVPLKRRDYDFLKWDSFLECGSAIELDDYIVDEAACGRPGVIGGLAISLVPSIVREITASVKVSENDKREICAALDEHVSRVHAKR